MLSLGVWVVLVEAADFSLVAVAVAVAVDVVVVVVVVVLVVVALVEHVSAERPEGVDLVLWFDGVG